MPHVIDMKYPNQPQQIGSFSNEEEDYNDIEILDRPGAKRYALIGSNVRGLVIFDVTDPANLREVTNWPGGTEEQFIHTVFLQEREGLRVRAYLGHMSDSTLDIVEVTNPEAPVLLGTYKHPGATDFDRSVHDMYVDGDTAYLSYTYLGLVVVNVADPQNIQHLWTFDDYNSRWNHSSHITTLSSGRKIAVVNDEVFKGETRILDIDPASPTFKQQIGSYLTRPEVAVHECELSGDRAYCAAYHDGLRVLDLSDPTYPTEIAHINTWDPTDLRTVSIFDGIFELDHTHLSQAGLLYAADGSRGLVTLRLTR